MDARIEVIFMEQMKGDKSFQEKPSVLEMIFGENKFTQSEMRETWNRGIKHGIGIGLRVASLEGQKINRYDQVIDPRHKEFLDKFYELAKQYNCAITYHPRLGSIVIDREY